MKGHGFSRADKANRIHGALAPEGSLFANLDFCHGQLGLEERRESMPQLSPLRICDPKSQTRRASRREAMRIAQGETLGTQFTSNDPPHRGRSNTGPTAGPGGKSLRDPARLDRSSPLSPSAIWRQARTVLLDMAVSQDRCLKGSRKCASGCSRQPRPIPRRVGEH